MLESASRAGGCAWAGGLLGGVAAPGGVSAPGGLLPGGCLLQGGLLRGVSAPGGGYPSMHRGRHPPPTPVDRILDTLVKILPWPNFVAAGNKNAFQ